MSEQLPLSQLIHGYPQVSSDLANSDIPTNTTPPALLLQATPSKEESPSSSTSNGLAQLPNTVENVKRKLDTCIPLEIEKIKRPKEIQVEQLEEQRQRQRQQQQEQEFVSVFDCLYEVVSHLSFSEIAQSKLYVVNKLFNRCVAPVLEREKNRKIEEKKCQDIYFLSSLLAGYLDHLNYYWEPGTEDTLELILPHSTQIIEFGFFYEEVRTRQFFLRMENFMIFQQFPFLLPFVIIEDEDEEDDEEEVRLLADSYIPFNFPEVVNFLCYAFSLPISVRLRPERENSKTPERKKEVRFPFAFIFEQDCENRSLLDSFSERTRDSAFRKEVEQFVEKLPLDFLERWLD